MLAGAAGVFGDLQRQQVGAAGHQRAHAVARCLAVYQFEQQGCGLRAGFLRRGQRDRHQASDPRDALAAVSQAQREGNACPLPARQVAHRVERGVAAGECAVQPFGSIRRYLRQGAPRRVGLRAPAEQGGRLLQEDGVGRIGRAVVAQHLGVGAQGSEAMGEQAQRLEGLLAQPLPAGQGVGLGVSGLGHDGDQPRPARLPHRLDPFGIVGAWEDLAEDVHPQAGIGHRGQPAPRDPARQPGHESALEGDSGLGEQVPLPAAREQREEVPGQRGRVDGFGLQPVAQAIHPLGGCGGSLVGRGPQRFDQFDQPAVVAAGLGAAQRAK